MFNLQENRQSKAHLEGNMLPVINMTFLLLLFFIVVGSFSESLNQDIPPPESISEALTEASAVELNLSRDGILSWEDKETTIPAWAASYRADGLPVPRKVRLRADANTPATYFIPVIEDLKYLKVSRVALVTVDNDNVL